jgi:membrane peptidoglycan carboxypeptidase
MFLGVSVLAGVLVASLAIPVAALTGLMSTSAAESLSQLPAELETPPVAERTKVYMKNGEVLAQFFDEFRVIVPLEKISPVMQYAQIAIEDDRFYEHGALDLKALVKAFVTYFTGDSGGGGSTLTQQYVKQVLVDKADNIVDPVLRQIELDKVQERSIKRKIAEMRYSIALEQRLSKDEILERYLNIANYGDGAYGVEAAAQHYFSVSAADLNLAQAAMLAGIVQTPVRNPANDPNGALARRDVVLDRMLELKLVSASEVAAAKAEEFDDEKMQYPHNGCYQLPRYGQLCRLVWNYLMNNTELGDTVAERENNVKRGGYEIYTFVEPKFQNSVQSAVSNYIAATDPVTAAMVVVQPGTGVILGAAQNRSVYGFSMAAGESAIQHFAPPRLGGDQGYQAGSTFKGFTVAAALKAGVPPSKMYNAASSMSFGGRTFRSCEGPFTAPGPWTVINTSDSGVMNMLKGAGNSVNTYFMQLEQSVGVCAVVEMARDVGMETTPTDEHPNVMAYHNVAAFTLGVGETQALSMATAYATFAARGVRCDPIIIRSIIDRDGEEIPTQQANCRQVIDPGVADGVNYVLQGTFNGALNGTGSRARLSDGRQAAGKSGTTEDNRDAWFVGYTPEAVGVAMIGVDSRPENEWFWSAQYKRSLTRLQLPSGRLLSGTGSADATQIWRPGMEGVLAYFPATPFTYPPGWILAGKTIPVPSVKGMSFEAAQRELERNGFSLTGPKDTMKRVHDNSAVDTVVSADCEPYKGGLCSLTLSKGPAPQSAPTTPGGP